MSARGFNIHVTTRKQGVIKIDDLGNGLRAVDYRGTKVVTELDSHTIQLNTNGWLTVTSKTAINRYFQQRNLNVRVFQKDFTWYVDYKGQVRKYEDNILIGL